MATVVMTRPDISWGGNRSGSRGLHIAVWIVQGVLAMAFLSAGVMKLVVPADTLAHNMPWVRGAMGQYVHFIGLAETLGALGLILPSVTKIKPGLTVLAALGLAVAMVLAVVTHIARQEYAWTITPIILAGASIFVAWARATRVPILSRADKRL